MGAVHRGISLFALCLGIAFAIAALVSYRWVEGTYQELGVNQFGAPTVVPVSIRIGLRKFFVIYNDQDYSAEPFSYDNVAPYDRIRVFGAPNDWKSAGLAAYVLGIMAIIFAGVNAVILIFSFFSFRQFGSAILTASAWLAGFCFILGAIIYQGVRPGFDGDVSYEWPFALYLTAGILCDISAYVSHSGSYVPRKAEP